MKSICPLTSFINSYNSINFIKHNIKYNTIQSFNRSYHLLHTKLINTPLRYGVNSSIYSLFARSMFIQTQSTPNPNSMKFLPGKPVLASLNPSAADNNNESSSANFSTVDFPSFREAQNRSPLASALFQIEGVNSVLLGSDFISVNITEGSDWQIVKPSVYAAIMDFYASNQSILTNIHANNKDTISDTTILPDDSEIVAMIKELIETRIKPAVQEDGGDILYAGFDETSGIVKVSMQGSCKGCSSSQITLKNGIENMLMHYVPEVKGVEEVKDEETERNNAVSQEQLNKLQEKLDKSKSTA
jgi:Fe-S cluster biogenesis protein NfuA